MNRDKIVLLHRFSYEAIQNFTFLLTHDTSTGTFAKRE
jgi:hypothetical protein